MARAAPRSAPKKRKGPTVAEIGKVIKVVPDVDVKRFLASELRRDEEMMGRFEELAGRFLAKSRGADHYAKVERLIGRGLNSGRISDSRPFIAFTKVTKDARVREGVGDYVEAARIYGQIASAIIDWLPNVFVVPDELREQAGACILAMGGCAEKAGDTGVRMRIARHLAEGYARDYKGACDIEYEEALGKVPQKPGDKKRLRGVIEEVLSGGPQGVLGRDRRAEWGRRLKEYGEGKGSRQGESDAG